MNLVVKMVATLLVIGLVSGGVLQSIFSWADPMIKENARIKTEKSIYKVQPNAKSYEKVEIEGLEVYKTFNEAKELIGYAMVYSGNGFADKIRVMAGVESNLEEIKLTGIEILYTNETPGLGTKIKEAPFKPTFVGLSANPTITLLKGKAPSNPNEVQAITGATISSKAVVDILNNGIAKLRSEGGNL